MLRKTVLPLNLANDNGLVVQVEERPVVVRPARSCPSFRARPARAGTKNDQKAEHPEDGEADGGRVPDLVGLARS